MSDISKVCRLKGIAKTMAQWCGGSNNVNYYSLRTKLRLGKCTNKIMEELWENLKIV